jgi:hypothetical protein
MQCCYLPCLSDGDKDLEILCLNSLFDQEALICKLIVLNPKFYLEILVRYTSSADDLYQNKTSTWKFDH